ncbi:MAG: type IV secretion system DNA-binding domain-containing protein [Oscillospiraceae bacterium]|nr:type IV secretion system DNA-binding domain-containing protein [Oscillospiraceae bacterium]
MFKFLNRNKGEIFDFERDHKEALHNPTFKGKKPQGEATLLGTSGKKDVFISNNAKHVFVCGTTGSGKTIALSNFIKSGANYNYPMLIVDGKGDTDTGSILEITKTICTNRKIYVINFNDPKTSNKYNPFKNTNIDVIKDMLINMTKWSEEHYKLNTERYIQRLCKLLEKQDIIISLESLTNYLPSDNFLKLSKELMGKGFISKTEYTEDIELTKTSGQIAESAAARFATIKESNLGTIFDASGIDIYTALSENAIILFILNPLLYPEMSPLIGNLIIIDSKKAVSNFYNNKKNRIFYLLDEINVYTSPALLDLVNKSRSANITCILATQSLSDLDKVAPEFKEQVVENCNNYIVLRQNSPTNAEYWANVLGTRQTMQATYQMKQENGGATSTDLGSLRKTREFLYHPDEIKSLQQGNAIFLSRDENFHTKIKVNKPY